MIIILVVVLLIFLGAKIIQAMGEAAAFAVVGTAYTAKGIKGLIQKHKAKKAPRRVIVHCLCSRDFEATPRKEDDWIVKCPQCGRNLRVDTSKKKKCKKEETRVP